MVEVYDKTDGLGKENAVAIKTELAWVADFKAKAAQPYTEAELARLRAWAETVDRINAAKRWPPGTLQGLLDKARVEDNERYEQRNEDRLPGHVWLGPAEECSDAESRAHAG